MPFADKEKAKAYNKAYHLRTWISRQGNHQEWKRKRRMLLAEWLKNYKSKLACIHCNENHPACIDFHHVNAKDKEGSVANMISEGYAIKTILNEINKCIILCRNCHAKEHYKKITI